MIYTNRYQKIIDTINEPYKNRDMKPNIHGKHIFPEKALILLDMPTKEKAYHASSYEFLCFKDTCTTKGQIIINRDIEKDTNEKIEKLNCNITAVHKHPESIMYMLPGKVYEKESHIHFECENKSYSHTLDIARFLRNF